MLHLFYWNVNYPSSSVQVYAPDQTSLLFQIQCMPYFFLFQEKFAFDLNIQHWNLEDNLENVVVDQKYTILISDKPKKITHIHTQTQRKLYPKSKYIFFYFLSFMFTVLSQLGNHTHFSTRPASRQNDPWLCFKVLQNHCSPNVQLRTGKNHQSFSISLTVRLSFYPSIWNELSPNLIWYISYNSLIQTNANTVQTIALQNVAVARKTKHDIFGVQTTKKKRREDVSKDRIWQNLAWRLSKQLSPYVKETDHNFCLSLSYINRGDLSISPQNTKRLITVGQN